ncbi:hypothetical protein SEA_EVY_255 [Streptomyces phage Evy]|nr:hypothetical protein KNU67_gp017 [Streptomyces phage Evy]YP_010103598.1 hypothetical protein KNU67_gp043 [Streptomyces phage Evy]UEM46804.1 hypothetical protein SEA_TARGARYEN_15 [Streptomyces phage Targaryen]QDH93886.1 hypothetical protein SEA_EVY_17 [Streptomyces phage Evy]QDH94089.1 hypothetical protein SEA_EVY_255 [Streptomyces phage Evy]UEM47011.1 hypothetical protein SEA_TARGARYEN_266 [Streptomyces phage Targaryen]
MRKVLFSIEDAKAIAKDQGNHFFSADTMRWWKSRISDICYSNIDGDKMFFVSSERNDDYDRRYTVRVAKLDENGYLTIDTVSEFQEYASRSGAHDRAQRERLASILAD